MERGVIALVQILAVLQFAPPVIPPDRFEPGTYLVDAIREANEQLRTEPAADAVPTGERFMLWVDPSSIDDDLAGGSTIFVRLIVRHPNRQRYMTASERRQIEDATKALDKLSEQFDAERQFAMVPKSNHDAGREQRIRVRDDLERIRLKWKPKLDAASEEKSRVWSEIMPRVEQRRIACEIVSVSVEMDDAARSTILRKRCPVLLLVTIDDVQLETESDPCITGTHVSAVRVTLSAAK